MLSISHSRDWVMVGMNHSGSIGVDIEAARPCPNALEIAQNMFSHSEANRVMSDPQLFWGLWVIREAIAKMDGQGLSGAFAVDPALVLEVVDKGDIDLESDRLQVSYRKTRQYHFAVAVLFNSNDQQDNVETINYHPLRLADVVNFLLRCE